MKFESLLFEAEKHGKNVRAVDDEAVRFVRMQADRPISVCYLALAKAIPSNVTAFEDFQDRVIGKDYFEGGKSLQWNNYLYFVGSEQDLNTEKVRQLKDYVESDRNYARKFVVNLKQLKDALSPAFVSKSHGPTQNVLTVWNDILEKYSLADAFSYESMRERLQFFESHKPTAPSKKKRPNSPLIPAPPFITQFELSNYREFPAVKNYAFGSVNLLVGPNATGKTSLLEAIELFYCGRQKRNPKQDFKYKLVAEYENGEGEIADNHRNKASFRDRNLFWYGQPEQRTNDLYLSFARFNFLDTDAATKLSESDEDWQSALSTLLIGPEASTVWSKILKTSDALEEHVKGLRLHETRDKDVLRDLKEAAKADRSAFKASDSIRSRLNVQLARLHWSHPPIGSDRSIDAFIGKLSEIVQLGQQASTLGWISAPINLHKLRGYYVDASARSKRLNAAIKALEDSSEILDEAQIIEFPGNEADALFQSLALHAATGVQRLAEERATLAAKVSEQASALAGFSESIRHDSSENELKMTVAKFWTESGNALSDASSLLEKVQASYSEQQRQMKAATALQRELVRIAEQILEVNNQEDVCPLCETTFPKDRLAQVIHHRTDTSLATNDRQTSELLNEAKRRYAFASDVIFTAEWLSRFCAARKLKRSTTVSDALAAARWLTARQSSDQWKLHELTNSVQELEAQGYTVANIHKALKDLSDMGIKNVKISKNGLEQLRARIREAKQASERLKRAAMTSFGAAERRLAKEAASLQDNGPDPRQISNTLAKNAATTRNIYALLNNALANSPWSAKSDVSRLLVDAKLIRGLALDFQNARIKERQLTEARRERSARIKEISTRLNLLRTRLKNALGAANVLKSIRAHHSLNDAMETAVSETRGLITKIFRRIHSPFEFASVGKDLKSLHRVGSSQVSSLTEISTGQRAAFALSIFLAQNAELKSGPPVVLIDDPIAHIDDLNALSFFDYLRELALTGNKQIFFATANEKIATLFQRKFDFLGSNFKRIEFRRK